MADIVKDEVSGYFGVWRIASPMCKPYVMAMFLLESDAEKFVNNRYDVYTIAKVEAGGHIAHDAESDPRLILQSAI